MAATRLSTRPDQQRVIGQEEAMAIGIQELLETRDNKIKTLSDLDDVEIGTLALLSVIGKSMKIKEIVNFVEEFCQFRVSRYRLGRREVKDVVTYGGTGGEDSRRKKSIKDLFGGMRG